MSREAAAVYLAQIKELVEKGEIEEKTFSTLFVLSPYIISIILFLMVIFAAVATAIMATGMSSTGTVVTIRWKASGPKLQEPGPGPGMHSFILLAGLLVWAYILLFALALLEAYIVYRLVDRENRHWRRITLLYENVIGYLRAVGVEEHRLVTLRNRVEDLKMSLKERSAAVWAILYFFIGIVILYILHFLSRDVYEHGLIENKILSELETLLAEKGVATPGLRFAMLHDRNTILYAVISIITFGLFVIYWLYEANKDWNEHVVEHRSVERRLVEALEQLMQQTGQQTQ